VSKLLGERAVWQFGLLREGGEAVGDGGVQLWDTMACKWSLNLGHTRRAVLSGSVRCTCVLTFACQTSASPM
jgi:hypothetical protein